MGIIANRMLLEAVNKVVEALKEKRAEKQSNEKSDLQEASEKKPEESCKENR